VLPRHLPLPRAVVFLSLLLRPPPSSTLFPYTTLFRSSPSQCAREKPVLVWGASSSFMKRSSKKNTRVMSKYSSRITIRSGTWKRSEEHTSELQSRENLVCRLLLEKKNNTKSDTSATNR